jgi:hypothetical protein
MMLGYWDDSHPNAWECGRSKVPPKHYKRLCYHLRIPREELKQALLNDFTQALDPSLSEDRQRERVEKYIEFLDYTFEDEIYY